MKPLSDRTLERYLLGELSEVEKNEVDRTAAADPAVASRLQALRASDAEILERYPPAMIAARIRERLDAAPAPRCAPRGWIALPAAAAAALLLVVLMPLRDGGGDGERIKGLAPRLALHRKAGAGIEPLADGGRAASGDVVQISYVAGGARYGAIFSIDGAGVVTWHLPSAVGPGTESPVLKSGGEVPLGFAYELDDAPGFERFFFVTSARPFALEGLRNEAERLASDPAAARAGGLGLPRGTAAASLLLVKEAR